MDESSRRSDILEHADLPAPRTTRAAEGLPRRHFTIAAVEAMVEAGLMLEDERVELIGGELVPMSPKGSRHDSIKTALLEFWYRRTTSACTLTPETTFRLSDDTYVEPDIVVYDRTRGLTGLTGDSVLLVVEIAVSSLRFDMGRKAALYASFGIRELWVIDAVKMTMRVHRSPDEGGFTERLDLDDLTLATPVFAPGAFALRLADLDI